MHTASTDDVILPFISKTDSLDSSDTKIHAENFAFSKHAFFVCYIVERLSTLVAIISYVNNFLRQ